MNTTLSTPVDVQSSHPPHTPGAVTIGSQRQVSAADRLALHLGLALITWSRRSRVRAQVASHEARSARASRLTEHERLWRLSVPQR